MLESWSMKKLLAIVVLGLLFSNVASSKNLGIDKTVDHYLSKEGYSLHSTDNSQSGVYIYHLIKGGSPDPDIITCAYTIKSNNTICFAP